MLTDMLNKKAQEYLNKLCVQISERSVGSQGNIQATDFFYNTISALGWQTKLQEFKAIDWKSSGAALNIGNMVIALESSPYSLGCNVEAELVSAATIEELENVNAKGKILLLYGDIVKEQLMPKNFIFYNPEESKKKVALLEKSQAAAIICATGRNGALAGGAYPFPFIEDGDFDIPSVYMKDVDAEKLKPFIGARAALKSGAERIQSKGYNVIANKGKNGAKKIAVTAHIDSKKGTPGALDNATGVITLLLLAEALKDYDKELQIEIIAFNGEDYYAVPGQMEYIKNKNGNFNDTLLNINIDLAGYIKGDTAFSLFNLPDDLLNKTKKIIDSYSDISEGILWPQGDHSIFIHYGVPAIAIASKVLIENFSSQDITHTPKDNISIVNTEKLVELSIALIQLIESI